MRKLFTLFVSVLAALTLQAQELRVSGTVLDADNGEALIGVSVV